MTDSSPLVQATGEYSQVPPDWMSATGGHALVLEDPALIWLKYHGPAHGFEPDSSPYEFLDFIAAKGQQFEDQWAREMAPEAIQVCAPAYQVRSPAKVRETFELMQKGAPVIVQGALWWAPERIYGVPDLLLHTSWLESKLPDVARSLGLNGQAAHYIVFDLKFTSKLESAPKAAALRSYAAQVRIYSYMLGHLQGVMPQKGFLVTRDRIWDPVAIEITSTLGQPLDEDLAALRDRFVEIKVNGAQYTPWQDAIVASNIGHHDNQWYSAKKIIAYEKTPGRDPAIVRGIGQEAKRDLASKGFPTLDSLLAADPETIPLEECHDLGPARARRIRTMLQANRAGVPVLPAATPRPPHKEYEFYVDFEYFSNINVDFERQWPTLDGCEMIFMVGLGWEQEGKWSFRTFVARAENHGQERAMLRKFLEFLMAQTQGAFADENRTAFYHWTEAEVWQALRASARHQLSGSHPLRRLPWYDLQQTFRQAPIGLPGAWNYQLKEIARALGSVAPRFGLEWPGDLDRGLRAMVMGWKAYENPSPLQSKEMQILKRYLEADCKALWQILRWLRSTDA